MSFLFPRISYAPVRCAPARHEIAPLFSLLDETFNELQRATRQTQRKAFNPRFNVTETKEAYSLEGELPGIDQKNLSIEFVDEHTLTIKGRTESHTESGRRPEAVETEKQPAAVEDSPASETSSVKSHKATVEDEEEQPANATAAAQENTEVAAPTPSAAPAKVEAQAPKRPESHRWISERHVGEFSRSFSFPARVNQETVKASLKNGILSIVVPKAPVPESRRINIE